MNNFEYYCRLCATIKQGNELTDLQANMELYHDVSGKLTRINATMDFTETVLPKTVCTTCLHLLDTSYSFVIAIEQAQATLNDFKLVEIKTEPVMSDSETIIIYEPPDDEAIPVKLIKDEIDIKIEMDTDENSDLTDDDVDLNQMKQTQHSRDETEKSDRNKEKSPEENCKKGSVKVKKESKWKNYNWKCCHCLTTFTNCSELIAHSITLHKSCNPYQCNTCMSRKYNLDLFIKHIHCKHDTDYKLSCYKCYKTFPSISQTLTHRKKHEITPHICPGCNQCFANEQELKSHVDNFYETRRDLNKLRTKYADGLTCLMCKKTLKGKESLSNHLLLHMKSKNSHICELCGYSSNTYSSLQSHKLCHINERPFKCKLCTASFKTQPILNRHVKLHDEKKFACEKCDKKFIRQVYLKRHYLVHSNDLPWECDVCNKRFKRKEFLVRHKRLHEGVKPYSCEICNTSYYDWPNYNKHMKTLHGKDMSKTKRTPDGVFRIDSESGELIKPKIDEEILEWQEKLNAQRGQKGRRKRKIES